MLDLNTHFTPYQYESKIAIPCLEGNSNYLTVTDPILIQSFKNDREYLMIKTKISNRLDKELI